MSNEYKILSKHGITGLYDLIETVNLFLKDGWKCQGGIMIVLDEAQDIYSNRTKSYYQAMIKERQEDD